jgi:FkbM family methyltransferase
MIRFEYQDREIRFFVPSDNDFIASRMRTGEGFYEKKYLQVLLRKNLINKGMTVVDVGAHIGNHSIFFALHCERVFSFEPRSDSFALLCRNIVENGIKNVDAMRLALSARSSGDVCSGLISEGNTGATYFWYAGESRKFRFSGERKNRLIRDPHPCYCPTKRLDDLNLGPVHFLKVDVEGMELEVLKGAEQTIQKWSPLIMVEVVPEVNASEVRQWLKSWGYVHSPGWAEKRKTWLRARTRME